MHSRQRSVQAVHGGCPSIFWRQSSSCFYLSDFSQGDQHQSVERCLCCLQSWRRSSSFPHSQSRRTSTRMSCALNLASALTVSTHLYRRRRDQTITEEPLCVVLFVAQGGDAARCSSTDGRAVSHCSRWVSGVMAPPSVRRHCCQRTVFLVKAHAWLRRDRTSPTPPGGHHQPPLRHPNCRYLWKARAHGVCLCSFLNMDWRVLRFAKMSEPLG